MAERYLTARTKRGITLEQAAQHCGISVSSFRRWQAEGIVPRPWPGTKRYDLKALDQALDKLSAIEETELSAFERWEKERAAIS